MWTLENMHFKSIKILVILGLITLCHAYKSYTNYKVYRVVPKTDEQWKFLKELQDQKFDFWTDKYVAGNDVRIMVAPEEDGDFNSLMKSVKLVPEVSVENVQE